MSTEDKIQRFLEQGEILKAEQMITSLPEKSARMVIMERLIQIFHAEVEHDTEVTVFDYSINMEQLAKHFVIVKLLIRRLEFDLPKEYQKELYDYCREYKVSEYFLVSILLTNVFERGKVCRQLIKLFEDAEGKNSWMGRYFRQTLYYLEENQA